MTDFSVDDRRAVLRALEQIAREAGEVLLRGYRRPGAVAFKGPVDLVTDFDRRSEELIRERIAVALPGVALVAEEGGGELRRDRPTIYADPLDGTTNFAHGHPVFAVSLGLLEPNEGPTVGVVFVPVLGLLWSGAVGHGAHRNGEAMKVSDERELRRSLLATGFPYDRGEASAENDRQFAQFEAIERRGAQGVRRLGSAACDLCFVADGTYDGYWERKLSPWDLAAGAACVLAAGGTLSSLDGGPADLCTGSIVASNGHIHQALLAALDERGRAIR